MTFTLSEICQRNQGAVYLFGTGSDGIKIGWSGWPERRLEQVRRSRREPRLELLHAILTPPLPEHELEGNGFPRFHVADWLEWLLHSAFGHRRSNPRSRDEWFRLTPSDLRLLRGLHSVSGRDDLPRVVVERFAANGGEHLVRHRVALISGHRRTLLGLADHSREQAEEALKSGNDFMHRAGLSHADDYERRAGRLDAEEARHVALLM